MKRIVMALLATTGAVALILWQPWNPGAATDAGSTITSPQAAAGAAQGYRAAIDPATGELTSEPQPVDATDLPPALRNALSTSPEGLVERPSPVPGGGVMVDLQGRFQNTSVATVGAGGSVETNCVTDEAASDAGDSSGKE